MAARRGPKLTVGNIDILREIRARLQEQEANANGVANGDAPAPNIAQQAVGSDGDNDLDAPEIDAPDPMSEHDSNAESEHGTAASDNNRQQTPLTSASEGVHHASEVEQLEEQPPPELGPPPKRAKDKKLAGDGAWAPFQNELIARLWYLVHQDNPPTERNLNWMLDILKFALQSDLSVGDVPSLSALKTFCVIEESVAIQEKHVPASSAVRQEKEITVAYISPSDIFDTFILHNAGLRKILFEQCLPMKQDMEGTISRPQHGCNWARGSSVRLKDGTWSCNPRGLPPLDERGQVTPQHAQHKVIAAEADSLEVNVMFDIQQDDVMLSQPYETVSVRFPFLPHTLFNKVFFMVGCGEAKGGIFACTREVVKAHGDTLKHVDDDYGYGYDVTTKLKLDGIGADTPRRSDICCHHSSSKYYCSVCKVDRTCETFDASRAAAPRDMAETRADNQRSAARGQKTVGKGVKASGSPFVEDEELGDIHQLCLNDLLHIITLGVIKWPMVELVTRLKGKDSLNGRVVRVDLRRFYAVMESTKTPYGRIKHVAFVKSFAGRDFGLLKYASEAITAFLDYLLEQAPCQTDAQKTAKDDLKQLADALKTAMQLLEIPNARSTNAQQRAAWAEKKLLEPLFKRYKNKPKTHLVIAHMKSQLERRPPWYCDQQAHEHSNQTTRRNAKQSNGKHRSKDVLRRSLDQVKDL